MIAIGLESLKYFDLPYESVAYDKASLMYHMKQAPLQVVIPGHAIEDFYTTPTVVNYFDTYEPFKKKVENVLQAMKILMIPKDNTVYDPKWLLLDIKIGDTGKQVEKMLATLDTQGFRLSVKRTNFFLYDDPVAQIVMSWKLSNSLSDSYWARQWERFGPKSWGYQGREFNERDRKYINKLIK